MSDFNMLSAVPYNVNVPEFQPERSAPVFPVVTRKYRCIEDVVTQDYARFNTLTWKIQQPDQSMVWQSVKLVLPLEMKAYRIDATGGPQVAHNMPGAGSELDMRVSSKLPCCNIAVAESPMGAFRQSSLTINGRIFSEVNDYRRVLDACYRGTGPSSYGDNHSLKPIVCRDIRSNKKRVFNVLSIINNQPVAQNNANGQPLIVEIDNKNNKTIDNAFTLLEHNGPFLERARKFQDELSYDGKTWTGLITNYLELGPFQARARVGNTAVPYVRDLHLRLNFDTNPAKFDALVGTGMEGLPRAECQVIPGKLFEWGTIANMKHQGETVKRTDAFIGGMKLRYTEKPYLEVQYVRYIEPMKSFYNLRCFEYQYEQSNPFKLHAAAGTLDSPKSLQRVTSRLLSYPSKVYLYGSLSDAEQSPWGMGNVRRSCMLKNIHCRVNQRPDIVFNPSQEECYEMFRRHTNSSLEYGSWLKSPIYVFDPVDLGQPDMLANDARLSLMEWDAEVSLTPLQIQEQVDMKDKANLLAVGYNQDQYDKLQYIHPANRNEFAMEWDYLTAGSNNYAQVRTNYGIVLAEEGVPTDTTIYFTNADAQLVLNKYLQFQNSTAIPSICPTAEIIETTSIANVRYFIRGFIWARVDSANGAILGDQLYYVPRTWQFDTVGNHADVINPWSRLTTVVDQHGAVTGYTVDPAAVTFFKGTIRGGGLDGRIINGGVGQRANNMVPGARAFMTDRTNGINNENTGGNAPQGAGPNGPGAHFLVADQATNATHQWACFRPSDDMVAGTGIDGKLLKFQRTNANAHQVADAISPLNKGNVCLSVTGNCTRNALVSRDQPATPNLRLDAQMYLSYPMNMLELHTADTHQFDYTLKTLYEFGNCQYQFTADGQPTQVLPNLLPVRDSTAIPIL